MPDCNRDCNSCGKDCSEREGGIPKTPLNADSHVGKVIGVVSGKGGVGKSSVTSMLAVAAARQGKKVAVLDADITGPSIPKTFGIKNHAMGNGEVIMPELTKGGIKAMSVNLLLENETEPVVWRGPILSNVVQQFWGDVVWGDIDVMFVDMPPGTGDVALTVYQSLPIDGIIIVTSPQDLVSMIVEKAVNMAEMMSVPALGIVENMSDFQCPDGGNKHYIFGESNLDEVASARGIQLITRLPMDPALARACDEGTIEDYASEGMETMAKALL